MPRRRTTVAAFQGARLPPPPEPAPVEVDRWSTSTQGFALVLAAKDANGHPFLLKLTAREAVRLAAHLLAGAEGLMREEDLRRGILPGRDV